MDATLVPTSRRTVVFLLLVAVTVMAQPNQQDQQQVSPRRIEVPPISDRITIAPLDDGPGAFAAVPAPTTSRILGLVINEAGFVVPSAGLVVVRSLNDGGVVARVEVDRFGQFSINRVEPGVYSAQLVDSEGALLTSSPSFTAGAGQVVQLTPVIPQRSAGALAALVGTNTARVVNAAVNAGVLAVATLAPISPQ